MLYITGDTHGGDLLLRRLYAVKHRKDFDASNENAVLLAGDAGIIWSGSSYEKDILGQLDDVLEQMNSKLFWIDGNHENFTMLYKYPVRTSGYRPVTRRIIHLPRGGLFKIGRFRVFAMGGALSVDRDASNPNGGYWPEELPNQTEIERGFKTLQKAKNVDIVLTHAAPLSWIPSLGLYDDLPEAKKANDIMPGILEQYLRIIRDKWPSAHWYFGHYHRDITLSLSVRGLYEDIICFEEEAVGSGFSVQI